MASPSDAPASVAPSPIAARRGFPHVTAVHVFIAGAVGILLAAFVLRVYRLGDNNIWWDEGLAIWAVRKSFLGVTAWTASDVHPPLYFWALWPWVRLVGESEFAARFLSLAIGMLTVAAVVPLGRLLGGPWVGLLAGLLLATSRFHVWWSQEMRMYALAGLLNVLALIALLRWWRSGSRAAWLGYVLAAAASLWTIYLSVVMLAVANVWVAGMLLVTWWRGRLVSTTGRRPLTTRLLMWLGAQVAVLALLAPWLMYALGRMSSWSVAETIDYGFVARLQATLLTLGISTDIEWVTPLMVALVLVFAAGLLALKRWPGSGPGVALLLLVVAVPSAVIFVLALPRGLFYNPRVEARYFLPFAPPVYILFAWSLAGLWRWRRPLGVAAGVFVAAAWVWTLPAYYSDRYLRDDLQSMAQALRAYARPDDAVILVSGNRYPVFLYYYERGLDEPRPAVAEVPRNALELTPDNVDRELRRVVRDHDRVWLAWVNGPLQDPQELASAWLSREFKPALSYGFAHNALTLFTRDGAPPPVSQPPATPARQPFMGGTIAGYDLPVREVRPGDTLRLGVYWDGPAASARVGLGTVADPNDEGTVVARPVALAGGQTRTQVELPIPRFMQPGDYDITLTGSDGSAASLGRLHVARTEAPATPDVPLDARFAEDIRLLGMSLVDDQGRPARRLQAGQILNVDLFWAADEPPTADYTVFVHLLADAFNPASGGPVWAGHDGPPAEGQSATSWWDQKTRLRDRHTLTLPDDLPPGPYQLEIGLYGADGARRPVSGAPVDATNRRVLVTLGP